MKKIKIEKLNRKSERVKKAEQEDINQKNNIKKEALLLSKNSIQKKKKKSNEHNPPKKNNCIFINNENKINNIKKEKCDINIENKDSENYSKSKMMNSKQKNKEMNKKIETIMEYNDEEINELQYDIAIKKDKRTYCIYYISLLKTNHNLIFSFFNNNDYNSRIVKIDLFFISFTIYYTINALFFNDKSMHKIYTNNGSFSLESQIAQIIYSSLISFVLNKPLKLLALSNSSIINFKQSKKNDKEKIMNLNKTLKIKFIIYFIAGFIFLLFFWYYISIFCAIYKNIQYHLIKDTLLSFGLSLVYPFGICLLPGALRICSLSKKNRACLYNLSKIIQII